MSHQDVDGVTVSHHGRHSKGRHPSVTVLGVDGGRAHCQHGLKDLVTDGTKQNRQYFL